MVKQITIRLPEQWKTKLFQEADKKGISLNEQILIILNQYLEFQCCRAPFQTPQRSCKSAHESYC